MAAGPIRGFPTSLQERVLGGDESYWAGLRVLFDNGLVLRLEGGGKTAGNYWTFGTFFSAGAELIRPAYADVQRWGQERRSYHPRAYLSPRKTDAVTRVALESLAGQMGAKYVALMLMERKPELVANPGDARWTIDTRFFARSRVEITAPAVAFVLDAIVDALVSCSKGCFAPKILGT